MYSKVKYYQEGEKGVLLYWRTSGRERKGGTTL